MLSLGDGVALAGLCGVIITALVIWNRVDKVVVSKVGSESLSRKFTNGYVRTSTCEAVKEDIKGQLKDLKAGNSKLFAKMDALDRYIREKGKTNVF